MMDSIIYSRGCKKEVYSSNKT